MDTTNKPKVTPKDFFLWLAAMVTLYWSATALILLIHQYIDVTFPDASQVYYGDPFSGTIRFAIASLIIVFPLYIWMTRLLHEDIRKVPEKTDLWVRRWLIYITLFVAGLTIAIDLITVVYRFLDGDLTTRFLLKALTILVVLGGGFWYYLEELRGRWEAKESQSKMIGGAVSLVVLASVIGGFFIIGSPFEQRYYKIDEQKVMDLQGIQSQLDYQWQIKRTLPAELEELNDPLSGYMAPVDPETGVAYTYEKRGDLVFALCATFNRESRNTLAVSVPEYRGGVSNSYWEHPAGEHCFERTIDPDNYPAPMKGVL